MERPDLANADLLALIEWYNQYPHEWQAIAADKNRSWPIPDTLKAKLPTVTGPDAIVIGAQRVTDALYMSQVDPGAVLAETGLLLLQVSLNLWCALLVLCIFSCHLEACRHSTSTSILINKLEVEIHGSKLAIMN